jgi:hypothetical protein
VWQASGRLELALAPAEGNLQTLGTCAGATQGNTGCLPVVVGELAPVSPGLAGGAAGLLSTSELAREGYELARAYRTSQGEQVGRLSTYLTPIYSSPLKFPYILQEVYPSPIWLEYLEYLESLD